METIIFIILEIVFLSNYTLYRYIAYKDARNTFDNLRGIARRSTLVRLEREKREQHIALVVSTLMTPLIITILLALF